MAHAHSPPRLLGLGVVLALILPFAVAWAGDTPPPPPPPPPDPKFHTIDLNFKKFGDLNEHCVFDAHHCGPTAATNGLVFLDNEYTAIKDSLVPDSPASTAVDLSTDMLTDPEGRTGITAFIQGKQTYFKDHGVDGTFAAQVNPLILDPGQMTDAHFNPTISLTTPTGEFLADQLNKDRAVEILITFLNPDGSLSTHGHYLTVVDLDWYDSNGNGRIDTAEDGTFGVIDPYNGNFEDDEKLSEGDGGLTGTVFTPDTAFTGVPFVITAIVSEGIVPEPSTWAMLLLGLGALGWRLRRLHGRAARRHLRIEFA